MFDLSIKKQYNTPHEVKAMNNTDYNLYKIFLYLYEQRSISKTANLLYVSQPAISYSLKELEDSYGVIEYDEKNNTYDFIEDATGINDFKRFIKKS